MGALSLRGRLRDLGRRSCVHWPLLIILLAALFLRAYWVLHEIPVLQGDETEYARLAENLLRSGAYVGMMEGREVMYPPFFPGLIAAASTVAGTREVGARLVTVLAGVALVLALFALAREMYGIGIGLLAATLAAGHPVLIVLSGAVYSESVYLPLMVAGIYFGFRALEARGRQSAIACGVLLGLAYLTRPEALFYPFVIVAAVLVAYRARGSSAGPASATALLVLAPFFMLAAPYVAWLSINCGSLRFEGKSVMNHTIAQRRNAGMSLAEAGMGIGPDLREEGPLLSPNVWVLKAPYPVPLGDLVRSWVASAHRNKDEVFYHLIRAPTFGSLVVVGLVTLGLLRRPWGRRRLLQEAVLMTIALGYLVILLGQHGIAFRYVTPLAPFLLVWGAKGVDEASRWAASSCRRIRARRQASVGVLQATVRCGLVLLLLLVPVVGGPWEIFRAEGAIQLDLRDAGVWLAHHRPGPKRIMGYEPTVPYYAGGTRFMFPVTPMAGLALDYVRVKRPDFLVLTPTVGPAMPSFYRDWFDHGVPDSAARLIYDHGGRAGGGEIKIYEWTTRAGADCPEPCQIDRS